MKAGRPKKIISYPTTHNFTYVLYDIIDKKTLEIVRVLGSSEEHAKSQTRFQKSKIRPTKVKNLTDELGHKQTHDLLKHYGQGWICKNGMLFFGHSRD